MTGTTFDGQAAARLAAALEPPAPSAWRHAPTVAAVLAAHIAGGWALMQFDGVRAAVGQAAPIFVEMLTPSPPAPEPPPPVPLPPPPPPPPKPPKPRPPPPSAVIATPAAPAPTPPVFVAPPPPEPAPPPEVVVVEPPPPAPPAPPTPPAPPPAPRTVSATDVGYLEPPSPVYPSLSRRVGETGKVMLRVLIDAEGQPRQIAVQASTGHRRLDDAAIDGVRRARFRPYTENGVPQPVWVLVPILFELER